jgi:5-methylcytosine-specific restriction endonuclease McrA
VRKSRKPLSERKQLVKALDTLFSLVIRLRDGKCVLCWKVVGLTCGHLITRSKYVVRWDEDNAFGQCMGCNLSHEYNPHPFTLWYIKKFGKDKYEQLVKKSNKSKKFSDTELRALLQNLQKRYEELKKEKA